MSHLPKDWRFLRMAWIYAVILTGNAERATGLVGAVLAEVGRRQDVVGSRRRRGLFFAILRRNAGEPQRMAGIDFNGPGGLLPFHELSEPGRSALSLFYTRLFDSPQLADVLGVTEGALPDILAAARSELSQKLPMPA